MLQRNQQTAFLQKSAPYICILQFVSTGREVNQTFTVALMQDAEQTDWQNWHKTQSTTNSICCHFILYSVFYKHKKRPNTIPVSGPGKWLVVSRALKVGIFEGEVPCLLKVVQRRTLSSKQPEASRKAANSVIALALPDACNAF